MTRQRTVHLVVPEGIDDPLRPSGGNTYDRRLRQDLPHVGWSVDLVPVGGAWPRADAAARQALDDVLRALPGGSVVLIDGLVASAAPEALVPAARRLRLVVLLHMPLGHGGGREDAARECAVVAAAVAVVTTSRWSASWLTAAYGLDPSRVVVAHPGVDPAAPAAGSGTGGTLLCVGAVVPGKGHDVLAAALARIPGLTWRVDCVGALDLDPGFVASLRRDLAAAGLLDRVALAGPRTGRDLDASYAAADALVLASRAETYGMVVTEALARALPVIATDVGGVREALGASPDAPPAGLLVPSGDDEALARSLERWLCEEDLRRDLRAAALSRRAGLPGWARTADRVARVLTGVAA